MTIAALPTREFVERVSTVSTDVTCVLIFDIVQSNDVCCSHSPLISIIVKYFLFSHARSIKSVVIKVMNSSAFYSITKYLNEVKIRKRNQIFIFLNPDEQMEQPIMILKKFHLVHKC